MRRLLRRRGPQFARGDRVVVRKGPAKGSRGVVWMSEGGYSIVNWDDDPPDYHGSRVADDLLRREGASEGLERP